MAMSICKWLHSNFQRFIVSWSWYYVNDKWPHFFIFLPKLIQVWSWSLLITDMSNNNHKMLLLLIDKRFGHPSTISPPLQASMLPFLWPHFVTANWKSETYPVKFPYQPINKITFFQSLNLDLVNEHHDHQWIKNVWPPLPRNATRDDHWMTTG